MTQTLDLTRNEEELVPGMDNSNCTVVASNCTVVASNFNSVLSYICHYYYYYIMCLFNDNYFH